MLDEIWSLENENDHLKKINESLNKAMADERELFKWNKQQMEVIGNEFSIMNEKVHQLEKVSSSKSLNENMHYVY